MVTIGPGPKSIACFDCGVRPTSIRIDGILSGNTIPAGTICLCETCRLKLARVLAPELATPLPAPTHDDVRKIVVAKTERVKDSLEKTVQSLLHKERQRTNQLVETTAANLRASIAAAIPRATDSTNCCSSFRIIGGNDIVHCIKVAGHGHEHEGRCYGRAFYWENPGEGPA